jgi:Rrf2 family cysteine metabolism transcriptional repressor
MQVTQKCQYALRAVFELAKRVGQGPVKIAEIADVQAIPPRFLEVILSQLKQAGFVESQRGRDGGYVLVRPAAELTVGDVMRFMQGPIGPVDCVLKQQDCKCPLYGGCVFLPMWQRAQRAMSAVYDTTTFDDLMSDETAAGEEYKPCYSI